MKGGVGKTTISVGLAYELAESFGKDVLLIDTDPQTNSTLLILDEETYREIDFERRTLADLFSEGTGGLMGEREVADVSDIIISNPWSTTTGKMDLIPSSIRLFESKRMLTTIPFSEDFLNRKLQSIHSSAYDYCIIDLPPSFDNFVISALGASDYYIVPIRPDYMSQQGLIVLEKKLNQIKDYINCELLGYVISMIPPTRSGYHRTIVNELEEKFQDEILALIKEIQAYSLWPTYHGPLRSLETRIPFVEIARRLIEKEEE